MGYIGTYTAYRGHIGMADKKMKATIQGLGLTVSALDPVTLCRVKWNRTWKIR